MIEIEKVDHYGVRIAELDRAMEFYKILGFEFHFEATNDAVVIVKNKHDVEINFVINSNNNNEDKNILMDVPDKYPGYAHIALRVTSIGDTIGTLKQNNISITQGPVDFGDGHLSVFIRDPDYNVIELRGRNQDANKIEDVAAYIPEN